MHLELAKSLDKNPRKVDVCLNSEGGDLLAGLAIYDRLMAIKDCTITATGEVSSTATIILQAGTLRRATPYAQFYFHLSSVVPSNGERQPTEVEISAKVHLDQLMYRIYGTRMTPAAIKEAMSHKSYFGVDTALKLGIIDAVWDGKK